jgi:hypothetical protein
MIKPFLTITDPNTLYFYPGYDPGVGQLYNSTLSVANQNEIHTPRFYPDNSVEYTINTINKPRWHEVILKSLQPDLVSDLKFKIYF